MDRRPSEVAAADAAPILGPVRCAACHAPGLFLFHGPTGHVWGERRWVERQNRIVPSYVKHRCTGKDLPWQVPLARRAEGS